MADSNKPNDSPPTVNSSLVRKLVVKEGKDSKRLAKDAEAMAGELLRLFILEARERAGIEAECETENVEGEEKALIRADHITKIAAELLMDFS